MAFADTLNHSGRSANTEINVAESKGTPKAGMMTWPRKMAYIPVGEWIRERVRITEGTSGAAGAVR